MPSISRLEVEHVARLARLALNDDELSLLGDQLSKILDHAGRVTSLNTEGVAPTSHAIALSNVFREDDVVPPLTPEQALAGAPEAEDGHFRVPRILEEND